MSSIVATQFNTDSARGETADPVFAAIQNWLCDYIARIFDMPVEQIDPDEKFDRHGLDSSAAVGLVGDLSNWVGCEVDPALTYDFPTITAVARELASRDDVRGALAHRI